MMNDEWMNDEWMMNDDNGEWWWLMVIGDEWWWSLMMMMIDDGAWWWWRWFIRMIDHDWWWWFHILWNLRLKISTRTSIRSLARNGPRPVKRLVRVCLCWLPCSVYLFFHHPAQQLGGKPWRGEDATSFIGAPAIYKCRWLGMRYSRSRPGSIVYFLDPWYLLFAP